MKNLLIICLLCASFLTSSCTSKTVLKDSGSSAPVSKVAKPPLTNKDDLPTAVFYFTTWCPYCKKFAPIVRDAETAYKGKIFFYYVDVESPEGKDFAAKFRPEGGGIPHTQFYAAKGEFVTEALGLMSYEKLEAKLKAIL